VASASRIAAVGGWQTVQVKKKAGALIMMDASAAVGDHAAGALSPSEIAGMFRLEPIEVDMFRDHGLPGEASRLFGGQVAAQALTAASLTVTGARPHSLHAYFLRPGDASRPVLFRVDRLHDGRTFHRRRVTAIQRGEPILCLESSFTADSSRATDYHPAPPMPPPEDCPEYIAHKRKRFGGRVSPWDLVMARWAPGGDDDPHPLMPPAGDVWFRFRAGVTDGVLPEVLITYLSDLTLGGAVRGPTEQHPAGREDVTGITSLDHSVWFHNPADLSGWLLFEKRAPAVGPARGLTTGHIFNRDGTLVASVTQEALLHTRSRD
jgi:acyl-CoA thioesterase-2